jgi:outer membrane receptor protein involved in Fe transport
MTAAGRRVYIWIAKVDAVSRRVDGASVLYAASCGTGMTREERMVRELARLFVLSLALIGLAPLAAAAQSTPTGRLTGSVKDPQGALIPRAGIVARNDRTGAEFRAVANEVGVWAIPSVPSGSYTVSVTAKGFRPADIKEIKVDAGSTATVDATLELAVGLANEIVVTASKFEEEVVNAPATATVIPERTIEQAPTQNLADLLRAVPGMNVAQTSASSFGVTGRAATGSLSGAQLALIDGRTFYQESYGTVAWNLVPTNLDDVKQVEVLRGPASAVWGSYAMNGVINIITKSPRETLGTSLTLGIGTFDRSGGIAKKNNGSLYYVNATHAQAFGDRWSFKLTGGVYTQDAFARPKSIGTNLFVLNPSASYKNEGSTQPKVEARVDYDRPDGKQHFTFSGGYAHDSGFIHGGFGGGHGDMSGSYGKVDYVRGTLRISGHANIFNNEGILALRFDPSGLRKPWSDHNQAYHLEFSDLRKAGSHHLFSYGGNLRFSRFDLRDAPEAKSRQEGGAYLQDEILLSDHFRWAVGARIDKFSNLEGAVFSPRTTFMVKPARGHTFRVSYNRAYLAPMVLDNYWKEDIMSWLDLAAATGSPALAGYTYPIWFFGNKNLKAPTLNAYEVGYTAVLAKDRVHVGAAIYINDSKNDIYLAAAASYTSQNPPPGWPLPPWVVDLIIANDPSGIAFRSVYVAQNRPEGSKTRNKGIELSVDARLTRAIDAFASYSWQAKPEPTTSAMNVASTNRFNAGLSFNYKRYLGNVSVGYVGRAYWIDVIGFGGWTDSYTVVNLTAGARLDRGGKYTAMIKISNLGNALVQNHIYGDILKRQITGEFRMRLAK